MSALGRHILVEFFGCNAEIMNDVAIIEQGMVEGAEEAQATVINSTFHHFSPYGVSGVVVIQESHLAIHTWPEYGYAAVDLFTCGDEINPWKSFDHLKKVFEANNYSALEMRRGATDQLERVDFDLSTMREEVKKQTQPKKYKRNVWFTDKDQNQALSLRYTGDILYRKKSEFQRVSVLETYAYGKMLAIDNMVMCTEKDEAHYHEMIVHPAVFTHQNVKNVLVIGGGDGGTVRELFKHEGIEKVTMVEIDKNVVEASKAHLPTLSCELDNPALDLKIEDGIAFVKNSPEGIYDLVIVDGSDPVGPAEGLFSQEFYTNCHRLLKDDGILVAQGESPMFNEKVFTDLNHCLKKVFPKEQVHCLLFSIPTYPTGTWSFQLAVKNQKDQVNDIDQSQVKAFSENHGLKYYNEGIHKAALSHPSYIQKMLSHE